MSYVAADAKKEGVEAPAEVRRIRITLTSRSVRKLENVCNNLVRRANDKAAADKGIKVKGPVRLPTKVLKITTRKTPNGEGSKTWDTYEMRIHTRLIE